ncbi:MAG: hypothetical protein M9928_05125 [Anaerolineae bacterium]|nr:hypothetical protein [Anaerolineae bacterium]MCO5204388.1 hypothetical protein [Anaerolineae bacterium]
MELEGEIVNVMETWPLQLTVASAEKPIHVSLTLDTTVTKNGAEINASQLSPSQTVRIRGKQVASGGVIAAEIVVTNAT